MDDIETICANSYRNFHTKGFDYLCITRRPDLTRKVYFFDGELAKLPELIMPHNHRYVFKTTVLAGAVRNIGYGPISNPHKDVLQFLTLYDRFSYKTPLNGGDGFTWEREEYVKEFGGKVYTKGQSYLSSETDVHTLDIRCEGTIIMLEQYEDIVPLDQPTQAWRRAGDKTPPNLSGLYDKMTPDHARLRIEQFLSSIT